MPAKTRISDRLVAGAFALCCDFDLPIETGMSFHVLSRLMGTGHGDDFISNTVLVTDNGAEVLAHL